MSQRILAVFGPWNKLGPVFLVVCIEESPHLLVGLPYLAISFWPWLPEVRISETPNFSINPTLADLRSVDFYHIRLCDYGIRMLPQGLW